LRLQRSEIDSCVIFAHENSSTLAASTANTVPTLVPTRGFNVGTCCGKMKKSIRRWGHRGTGPTMMSGSGPTSFQIVVRWPTDDGNVPHALQQRTHCAMMATVESYLHNRACQSAQDGISAVVTALHRLRTLRKATRLHSVNHEARNHANTIARNCHQHITRTHTESTTQFACHPHTQSFAITAAQIAAATRTQHSVA